MQLLKWLKEQCRGECLTRLFASMAGNEDTNARLRAAVALFYVSCDCGEGAMRALLSS